MGDFKFWGWDKKPRTMLRFVKPGDIFVFVWMVRNIVLVGLYRRCQLVMLLKYLTLFLHCQK